MKIKSNTNQYQHVFIITKSHYRDTDISQIVEILYKNGLGDSFVELNRENFKITIEREAKSYSAFLNKAMRQEKKVLLAIHK